MKILQISNYLYPHIGGIEQTARDILNALKSKEDCEQAVFCFNGGRETVFDELDGVKVTRCGCFAKVSSQSLSFKYKRLLKGQFKSFKPDVVIFHFPNPFAAHYLLKLLKKNKDCKLVVYYHLDITKQKILGKLFKGQTERLLKRADKIIATSPNYVEGSPFLSRYAGKSVVIPSCVNEERLKLDGNSKAKAEAVRAENKGKTICFAVGRHVEYKGLQYLIEASGLLPADFKIFIGGEGPLTAELKKKAEGDDKIEFLGKLTDEDLKAYLSACDIFCFPSVTKNEAFGLSLAEAMYFGKPAVTFNIPGSGVNYVNLAGVTGLEVENGNGEKFAEAIKKLADDSALREKLGKAAGERILQLFTFRDFSEKIINEITCL